MRKRINYKKYEAHIKEQDRVEQINLDELALYAYVRNQDK
jgi:flagellar FliJ protein